MERMASETGIPPVAGVADLVGVFDALAQQRPPGDPVLPALLFRGVGAEELVLGLCERLRSTTGERVVPHVVIRGTGRAGDGDGGDAVADDGGGGDGGGAGADDIAFLDRVAHEISRAAPAGMGRIELRAYWTIRDVLDTRVSRRRFREQRAELRDRLYTGHRRARPLLDWLDRLVSGTTRNRAARLGQSVLRPLTVDLPRLAFGRHLARGHRFRWFSEQISHVTGRGGDDFLSAALALTRDGAERANTTLVRRILVCALLHDLTAAFGRSLVSWQRRRRVTPFVVLLPDVRAGDPGYRFLDTLGGLLDELTRGTTFVIAALSAGTDTPPSLAPRVPGAPLSLSQAAQALDPLVRGHAVDARVLRVEVDEAPEDERSVSWLAVNRRVQPGPARLPVLVPVLTCGGLVLVVVALLASAWAVLDGRGPDGANASCPGIEQPPDGTEWIGLGDGTVACTFFPAPASELERSQRGVERAIAAENARVLEGAEQGFRYATVVFFAPLTVPEGPERLGQDSLRQLRGIALAQVEANRQARTDQNKVRVRVLLANAGDRFRYGPQVARRITAEAAADETLVGVVGIAQSRLVSREAIGILAEGNLPVVAGPVTGDAMIESSPYYYQVSPRNERVARVLVSFATSSPIAGPDGGELRPARNAVIVKDHSDEYSQNLADDLRREFAAAGHATIRTFSYAVEDPTLPMPVPDPPNQEVRVPSLDQLAHDVCISIGPDDIVWFTSRAQQLAGMLNSMRSDPACTGRITVIGGTDITKFVHNPDVELGRYPFLRLYYGAFASPLLQESNASRQFVADYTDAYGDVDITVDVSDPALAYDAFSGLQEAVNQASQGRLALTPDTVAAKLADGEVDIDGATGYINFDGALDIHRVPRDKPVLVLEARADPAPPLLSCGNLAKSVQHTSWGPGGRNSCPRDPP